MPSGHPACGFVRVDLGGQSLILSPLPFDCPTLIPPFLIFSPSIWYQSDYHKENGGEHGGTDQHNRICMRNRHLAIMP